MEWAYQDYVRMQNAHDGEARNVLAERMQANSGGGGGGGGAADARPDRGDIPVTFECPLRCTFCSAVLG